jgi:hypothetical protein
MVLMEEQTMYRPILPTLAVILGLVSWADAGFAASIPRASRPVIASATVDAEKNVMVVSGRHFGEGSTVVALGDRVLKIKSQSDHEVVVEIPAGLAPGSYRLTITSSGPSKQSSEPFSAALFAAR